MLTWDIIGILARLEWMGKKMNALWTFFTSPLGNIVLLIAGLLWLTAITVLPKLRKRVTVPAAEPPQRVGLEASTFRHLEVAFENLRFRNNTPSSSCLRLPAPNRTSLVMNLN